MEWHGCHSKNVGKLKIEETTLEKNKNVYYNYLTDRDVSNEYLVLFSWSMAEGSLLHIFQQSKTASNKTGSDTTAFDS